MTGTGHGSLVLGALALGWGAVTMAAAPPAAAEVRQPVAVKTEARPATARNTLTLGNGTVLTVSFGPYTSQNGPLDAAYGFASEPGFEQTRIVFDPEDATLLTAAERAKLEAPGAVAALLGRTV